MSLQQSADSAGQLVQAAAVGGIIGVVLAAVVGGLIGWLASILMKTNAQMGIIANVVVGIVGSAIGSWLFRLLGVQPSTLWALVAAVAGASLLIVLLRAVKILK